VVTIATYATLAEAQAACTRLWAAELHAHIPEQHAAGILGEMIGVRVQVPRQQAETARAVLSGSAEPAARGPGETLHEDAIVVRAELTGADGVFRGPRTVPEPALGIRARTEPAPGLLRRLWRRCTGRGGGRDFDTRPR
jgi:hypothetical protein